MDEPNYSAPGGLYAELAAAVHTGGDASAFRPKKRHMGIKVFCFVLAALALAAGILAMVAVLVPGAFDFRRSGTVQLPAEDGTPSVTVPSEDAAETDVPLCTIPQGTLGDGTTLTLHSSEDLTALSYEAIYTRNIDSVVSLRCYLGESSYSTGTGIIFSEDGYILTNEHVIEGAQECLVFLSDDSQYSAQLIGLDAQTDLAVLKIEAEDLDTAQFGDSDEITVGNEAFAIGNPLGESLRGTMTNGIISALNRNVQVNGHYMNLIQTTAALNAGNSGGPLLNIYGQVIGVCNMKMMSTTTTVEGLGFAIPSQTAKSVADRLIAEGEVVRAMLGITAYDLTMSESAAANVQKGVMVAAVSQGSDAFAKGVRPGDIITAANGTAVDSVDALNTFKADMSPGDILTLTILRDGVEMEIAVTLMAQEDVE